MLTEESLQLDLIQEALGLLGFYKQVEVFLPPLIDDFSPRRASWYTWEEGVDTYGGKIAWHGFDDKAEAEVPLKLRRHVALTLLISELPSRKFIKTATEMWAVSPDEPDFLTAYINLRAHNAEIPLRDRIAELEEELAEYRRGAV